jgi:predicted metal-dependent hydrolase
LAQPPRFPSKDPGLVEGGRGPPRLQDVQISAKAKESQANSQTLKQTFDNIFDSQKQLSEQMGTIQNQIRLQGLTDELKTQEEKVNQQLEARKGQEEILWKHKSRIEWLKEGDRNTKFFHRTTIHRRHTNRTTQLTSTNGEPIHSHEDLEKTLIDYYKDLLTEPLPDRYEAIAKVMQHVPSLVTLEKNSTLLQPIAIEEVDQALQDTAKCHKPRNTSSSHHA